MSKNSNLKRARNVFEGFSFQEGGTPIGKQSKRTEDEEFEENRSKFQKVSSNYTVQSLLESVSRSNSSQDSPWLEKRLPSRMDSYDKSKNIALAIEQRKKTGKPDLAAFPKIPSRTLSNQGSEYEVTRLIDDSALGKATDLTKVLSKSNLIRSSLLNKSIDDLEEYDPVETFRSKVQQSHAVERKQRVEQRYNTPRQEKTSSRKNRVVYDSDEDDDENDIIHVAEHPAKRIDTDLSLFEENTPQDFQRTKNLSKLSKNQKTSNSNPAISLLDSDEEDPKPPKPAGKKVKGKKALKVIADSEEEEDDEKRNSEEDDDEDVSSWRDSMTKTDLKEKAMEIIHQCESLSKNLRMSLLKWEGKKPSSTANGSSTKMQDCVNLIQIEDEDIRSGNDNGVNSNLIKNDDIKLLCPDLVLNSYQLVGVNWLKLLYQNRMNGVLADDMGLGKTIQTIAFLTYLSKSPKSSQNKSRKLPHFVVVPASTLANWENEFARFAPSMTLIKYHGSQSERQDLRQTIKDMIRHEELDIILSTYTMFERESSKLDRGFIQSLSFHFLVLDEAHSIKNADSSRYIHLNHLNTQFRLLLSGTPVQNNITELLALLSFLMPTFFKKEYCEILLEVFSWSLQSGSGSSNSGSNGNSNGNGGGIGFTKEEQKALMELKSILSPFVLRRLKSDVLNQLTEKKYVIQKLPMNQYQSIVYSNIIQQYIAKKKEGKIAHQEYLEAQKKLDINPKKGSKGKKEKGSDEKKLVNGEKISNYDRSVVVLNDDDNDSVGVIDLSGSPIKASNGNVAKYDSAATVYEGGNDMIIKGNMNATEARHLFTALRKAANHPLLLRISYTTEKVKRIAEVAYQEEYFGTQCTLQQVLQEIENNFSDYDLHELCLQFPSYLSSYILDESTLFQSPKMEYLQRVLPTLKEEGHRILLFSQWTRLLDLLEILLNTMEMKFVRLDGSTPIKERQALIDLYNEDVSITVFLLSTKAGGLGINLTSADTVILHDLDFNPENDKQAEDRCHRIGQTKPVTIYKLVTEGTVDEDIFDMGERKRQLSQAVLSNNSNNTANGGISKGNGKETEEDLNIISQILSKALKSVNIP